MAARLPDDEDKRLAVLHQHRVLDTAPQQEFEDLVRLAANVCNVPIAAVSLIDEHRQWFKAITGLSATETPRNVAFCAHTILQPNLMVVPDAQADERFADNPSVTGDPHVRFYAGMPLVTDDGYALGSLCVVDRIPRILTADQEQTLRLLARQVSSHLKAARLIAEREQFIVEREALLAERESLVAEKEHLITQQEAAKTALFESRTVLEERQRFAESIAAYSNSIIFVFDLDLQANIYSNPNVADFLGMTIEEVEALGSDLLPSKVHPDDLPRLREHIRKFDQAKDGEVLEFQFRVRHTSGEWRCRWNRDSVFKRHPDGTPHLILGNGLDVTERKRMAEQLRETETRFRTSVDTMEEGLVLQDANGAILFCNSSAERILGLSADQLMGRTSTDPHWRTVREDGSDFPGDQHPAMVALRDGIPQRNIVMGVHKADGSLTWVNINAVLLRPVVSEKTQDQAGGVVVTFSDITVRRHTEEVLRNSQTRLAEAQQIAKIGNWEYEIDTGIITWSEELFRLFEMDPTDGAPSLATLLHYYHPDDVDKHIAISAQAKSDGLPYEFDIRILQRDGSFRWTHAVGHGEKDDSRRVVRLFGTLMDIHERKLAEERFRMLFEHSSQAHVLSHEEDGIIDCNTAALTMMRCTDKTELLGKLPALMAPEYQPDGRRSDEKGREMCTLARQNGIHRFEWQRRAMDGFEYPVEVTLTPVMLDSKPALLSVWYDLTERKLAEEKLNDHAIVMQFQKAELEKANAELERLAATDGLTGLTNYRTFQERLAEEIVRTSRHVTPLSLILLDVDHFKHYNDVFGHPGGDEVLRSVAQLFRKTARESDVVARYGGEEFAVLLPQTDGAGAAVIAERLRLAIEAAPWPNRAITVSVGVSTLSAEMDNGTDLIENADKALYESKATGRNKVTLSCSLNLRATRRMRTKTPAPSRS